MLTQRSHCDTVSVFLIRTHLVAELHVHLLGHSGRHRHGRHPARLRAADLHPSVGVALRDEQRLVNVRSDLKNKTSERCTDVLQQVLRDLGGLS